MNVRCVFVLLCAMACDVGRPVLASGQPDPEFGDNGVLIVHADRDQPYGKELALDMLIDHAGRYVSVGQASHGPDAYRSGLVTRFLQDGTPDDSFGSGGVLHLEQQTRGFSLTAVREQADGKLIVLGYTIVFNGTAWQQDLPAVCRLSESGVLDWAFGVGGCRTLTLGAWHPGLTRIPEGSGSLALDAAGRILVLGQPAHNPDDPRGFAVMRLLPDGSNDLKFGGQECLDPAPRCAIAFSPAALKDGAPPRAMALDADGRIILATSINANLWHLMLSARYTTDGEFEKFSEILNFSDLTMLPETDISVSAIRVAPDGSSFVAATINGPGKDYIAVGKFDAEGMADATFGDSGREVYDFSDLGDYAPVYAMLVQFDQKLVLAGFVQGIQNKHSCYAFRVNGGNGAVDGHFGTSGLLTPSTLNNTSSNCAVHSLSSDGDRLILAGTADTLADGYGENYNPFLFRVDQDGLFRDGFDP